MIGPQPTSAEGVVISLLSHEGISITVDGKPGQLAILAEDGRVVVQGEAVAEEVEAVAVNGYKQWLQGKGWLKVLSEPRRRLRRKLGN